MGYLLPAESRLGPTAAGDPARSLGRAVPPLVQEATHPPQQRAGRLLQPGVVARTLLDASAEDPLQKDGRPEPLMQVAYNAISLKLCIGYHLIA